MLEVRNIDVFYGDSHIIFGLDLTIEEGESICLLGRNGTGKTTTMRSIMGLTPPRSGSIKFYGQEISRKQPYLINRLGIGYVPQDRGLMRGLTVRETLELGRKKNKGDAAEGWTLEKIYEIFPVLKRENQEAVTLSGGEQQMLTIARTLMGNPKLLLLDEPSAGLAPLLLDELCNQITILKKTGISILLAEQKLDFALSLADRCYMLEKGKICHNCLAETLNKDKLMQKRYLGVCGADPD